jgi:hypothetical protein
MHVDDLLQLRLEPLTPRLLWLALRLHRFPQLAAKSAPRPEIFYHDYVIYITDSTLCYGILQDRLQ